MRRWPCMVEASAGLARHGSRRAVQDLVIVFVCECTCDPLLEIAIGTVRRSRRPGINYLADGPIHLLQSGVRFNVIALWLGRESAATTHRYVEADLAMKEKALGRLEAPGSKLRRYKPPDALIRFLQALQLCAEFAGPSRRLA